MVGTPSQHNLIRRAAVESLPLLLLFSRQQQLQKAAGGRPNLPPPSQWSERPGPLIIISRIIQRGIEKEEM